jgi:hypothetical protein
MGMTTYGNLSESTKRALPVRPGHLNVVGHWSVEPGSLQALCEPSMSRPIFDSKKTAPFENFRSARTRFGSVLQRREPSMRLPRNMFSRSQRSNCAR